MIAQPAQSPALLDFTKQSVKKRFRIITEALESREPGESLTSVAKRAGVTRQTLYRYAKDPEFLKYYNADIVTELQASRKRTIKTLIDGANTPGAGQPALIRMLLMMTGDYRDKLDVNVDLNSKPVPLDNLPLSVKCLLVFCLQGGELPSELDQGIMSFMAEATIDLKEVRPEYKLLTPGDDGDEEELDFEASKGNGNGNGKDSDLLRKDAIIPDPIDTALLDQLLGEEPDNDLIEECSI